MGEPARSGGLAQWHPVQNVDPISFRRATLTGADWFPISLIKLKAEDWLAFARPA
jgi:hypothetical protein